MSDDSLFSKHWKIATEDPSKWTDEEKRENERLAEFRLPPLNLPRPWYVRYKLQWQVGLASACALLALILLIPKQEVLNMKGSMRISVYWERDGKPAPLNAESRLQAGDKVGAEILTDENSFAFWAVTNDHFEVISDKNQIADSRIFIEKGKSVSFKSSFQLDEVNDGEHLIIAVCPEGKEIVPPQGLHPMFDRSFVSQLMGAEKIKSSDCVFAGYRLRSKP